MTYGTSDYGTSSYGTSDTSGTVDTGFGSGGFGTGSYGDTNEPTGSPEDRGFGTGGFGSGNFGTGSGSDGFENGDDGTGYNTQPFGNGPFGGSDVTMSTFDSGTLPETAYFGGGQYGQGLYAFSNDQIDTIRDAWDSGGIAFHSESNTHNLEKAISTPLAFVSDDIEEINAAHHIQTAIDEELDKIGVLAGITRNTGESDPRFRVRIMAAFRAAITDTTHEDVLEFITTILETSSSRINIDWLPDVPGTAMVSVYEEDINNAAITASDLEMFSTQIVPAGHRIIVQLRGTFTFDGPTVEIEDEKGFSDESFTGGTFSESL